MEIMEIIQKKKFELDIHWQMKEFKDRQWIIFLKIYSLIFGHCKQ